MRTGPTTDELYFAEQATESTPQFWRRFGRRPDVDGKSVLDLGCGHGALALDVAQSGAHVLGIDLDRDRVAWAKDNIANRDVRGSLRFETAPLESISNSEFDVVISKDTFEHVADMEGMLTTIYRVMKTGGELWAGFAPLYHSPFGGHGRVGDRLPWMQVLPRRLVYRRASRHNRRLVTSLADVGLNGMTPAQFRSLATKAGFGVVSIAYNRGEKRLLPALSVLRRFAPIEQYMTVSIYAILRKP